ncbi:spore germination protein KA [Caloramator quimbayensis]|uniref:Spore germination protein KA n=1 Tax=Caloramator quimbayensis TaxID=1147123 RepID=A0A1T4Y6R7_9CLOT|nr:spore germination protein [Caloramator quimbayensis]SKA97218.1 spore germination protein KA [Caloramator quimbayensis]
MLKLFNNKKINNKNIPETLSKSLDKNIDTFKNIFSSDDTVIFRNIKNLYDKDFKACLIYISGMISSETVNSNIIEPLMNINFKETENSLILDTLKNKVISSCEIYECETIDEITVNLFNGSTVLLIENFEKSLVISSNGYKERAIIEPDSERVIRGPREGFTESLLTNLSLIRRRIKTPNLKFKFMKIGRITNTKICISYIDSIADSRIIDELEKRLKDIDIDGILDSGYIQEIIKDSPASPFKTIGSSERPDSIAAKLLEGRIAVFVDGSPLVLTLPYIFMEYFQSNEDYYLNYYYASFNRMLRVFGAFLSVSVPAVYVALMTYHQELIPTPLLLSIAAARQNVPFPTIFEVLGLLLVFEIVRETGSRLPATIGQTISIVGTLVIGQAAVEARIISAPVIIIVALTGITELLIPKLMSAMIIIRFILLILSSILGLYGYIFGTIGIFIHIFSIRSFGVPYMLGYGSIKPQDIKDTFIRAPWWYMIYRPNLIAKKNLIRQSRKSGDK